MVATPTLRVTADGQSELRFDQPFKIGRAEDCGLRIQNEYVSRYQAEAVFLDGQWWIRDLGSANGLYIGDQRVQQIVVAGAVTLRLGIYGPPLTFQVEQPKPVDVDAIVSRYFTAGEEGAGEHTRLVRVAFQKVQKKQKRKYGIALGALGLLLLAAAGLAYYQQRQMEQQAALAKDLFYSIKALDVDIANVEKLVMETQNAQAKEQVKRYRDRRREMQQNYDKFLTALRVYDKKMPEEDKLILRTARIFGECDLNTPPEFVTEVKNYIGKWQSSPRLSKAIETGHANGYIPRIAQEMLGQGLPPQFLYLAIQESDLNPYISGPPTYKGIAKGMWQFIPETGAKYGLQIGPLAEFRRPDTADDRHNWEKATHAAAMYIKDIYRTDAQASGLLVMASYNWGEHRVIKLIQSMPNNPRDRNFWRLLLDHRAKIPQETYDYVFYIFSAAVIGEDPQRFGFKFKNPLNHLEQM